MVKIIWGSPASGKTTYVRERLGNNDIVVDLDLICAALSMRDGKSKSDAAFHYGLDLREHLYDMIENRQHDFDTAWVIACLPKLIDRKYLEAKLKGELIHMDADINECIKRAMADTERKDKYKQVEIISKYFEEAY